MAQPRSESAQGHPASLEPRFTVDTRLFRELGELLVARDSTALAELVKNAYDADATRVTVYGERLESGSGSIVITDDGNGMTLREFENGFLRIASRAKEIGERRSPTYGRRFTGEKGVGRLAAHKLAREIDVRSVPRAKGTDRPNGVHAHLDWDQVEQYESLDEAGDAISLEIVNVVKGTAHGTEIALRQLREIWTETKIGQFLEEAETFAPPIALTKALPTRAFGKLLFSGPEVQDVQGSDPGFQIDFAGDFEASGEYWEQLLDSAEWVVEIRSSPQHIRYAVAPSHKEAAAHKDARRATYTITQPDAKNGPFFDARVLFRSRRSGSDVFRNWAQGLSGIRVYMEGFRTMPYGEPGNDWLRIDRDVGRRLRAFESLNRKEFAMGDGADPDVALGLAPTDSYVGGVFLTANRSPRLQALVNREGFVDNDSFALLRQHVRVGVDLMARARAAGRKEARSTRRTTREAGAASRASETPAAIQRREEFSEALVSIQTHTREAREALASGHVSVAQSAVVELESELERIDDRLREFVREHELLPVLASIGIQMAEFTHEINGLLGLAQTAESALETIRAKISGQGSRTVRAELAETHRVVGDLRRRLERQASYLVDVVNPDARHRRVRQSLQDRFDAATRLVARSAEDRRIRIRNDLPEDLESPPMFPAELIAVFANLLTNAIKAAGDEGRVVATGWISDDGHSIFRLENTGLAVQLSESERWFRPFESTTLTVDPVLGQGMGLGLPITRTVLESYGAMIEFVKPSSQMRTAIEIDFGTR